MNIVVIGSGGREHSIVHFIQKSKLCGKVFVLPGNGGTSLIAENVIVNTSNHNDVLEFCRSNNVEFVIIGPEIPLVEGLSDFLRQNGIDVFGPSKNAAMIESDKAYAKSIMKKANVPTASYSEFNDYQIEDAYEFADKLGYPVVIKANGLAAGKGVAICYSQQEVKQYLKEVFLDKVFGTAGNKIIIEEFMIGQEASIFAITDGENFICLPSAQDHKRIGEGDTGKNTGGMGAYAPTSLITNSLLEQIKLEIFIPTLLKMKEEGNPFSGCLYLGLMLTNDGPKVVEFNCRFGDPETQVVLPLLDGDILELLLSSAKGHLNKKSVWYNEHTAVTVVAASEGYPDAYQKGLEITGLENIKENNVLVFHAGTETKSGKLYSNGGRVLNVTSVINGDKLQEAINLAYQEISKIQFDNIYYRKDIGKKGLTIIL